MWNFKSNLMPSSEEKDSNIQVKALTFFRLTDPVDPLQAFQLKESFNDLDLLGFQKILLKDYIFNFVL